ncbi:MAG: response regulator transcription factor [Actinomycetota bacterium]
MGLRVAVIEDDPDIAELLRQVLFGEGINVTVVRNGADAMNVLESAAFDAAILDVMLPGKDGVTVMREIRHNPLTETLPVVMLSAKVDPKTTWDGWQAGCDLYLTKPFNPDKLVQALRKVMH